MKPEAERHHKIKPPTAAPVTRGATIRPRASNSVTHERKKSLGKGKRKKKTSSRTGTSSLQTGDSRDKSSAGKRKAKKTQMKVKYKKPKMRGRVKRTVAQRTYFPALIEPDSDSHEEGVDENLSVSNIDPSPSSSGKKRRFRPDVNERSVGKGQFTGTKIRDSLESNKSEASGLSSDGNCEPGDRRSSKRQRRPSHKAVSGLDMTKSEEPRANDVLLKQGDSQINVGFRYANLHPGNIQFRKLLDDHRDTVMQAKR